MIDGRLREMPRKGRRGQSHCLLYRCAGNQWSRSTGGQDGEFFGHVKPDPVEGVAVINLEFPRLTAGSARIKAFICTLNESRQGYRLPGSRTDTEAPGSDTRPLPWVPDRKTLLRPWMKDSKSMEPHVCQTAHLPARRPSFWSGYRMVRRQTSIIGWHTTSTARGA